MATVRGEMRKRSLIVLVVVLVLVLDLTCGWCRIEELEDDSLVLARRSSGNSGAGFVRGFLSSSVLSFLLFAREL